MSTYRLRDNDTLVLGVDDGPWETVTFAAGDFRDIRQATADEVARVIDRLTWATASVNDQGTLELATRSPGSQARLEVDLAASSAAGALGLTTAQAEAHGSGLSSASLIGRNSAPFALPKRAAMRLVVDGTSHDIKFQTGITAGRASVVDVVAVIEAAVPRVARVTRDGRVALTSPTIGYGSSLEVQPPDQGQVDAAAILGFAGLAAISRPYDASPARIICRGHLTSMRLVNLTGGPIELHLSLGSTLLPARQTLPLAASEAASDSLQRLVAQGQVRLMVDERD
jgi:hypothetical protein